ncbi:unnamed protein product [Lota lota]
MRRALPRPNNTGALESSTEKFQRDVQLLHLFHERRLSPSTETNSVKVKSEPGPGAAPSRQESRSGTDWRGEHPASSPAPAEAPWSFRQHRGQAEREGPLQPALFSSLPSDVQPHQLWRQSSREQKTRQQPLIRMAVLPFSPLKRMRKHGERPDLNKPVSSACRPFSNCYKSRAVKTLPPVQRSPGSDTGQRTCCQPPETMSPRPSRHPWPQPQLTSHELPSCAEQSSLS